MSESSDPDLIKITEIFLIPSSFLVAALGTADTNIHRAAVSLLGMFIAILWGVCSHEALKEHPLPGSAAHSRRIRIMSWLPAFFTLAWAASFLAHMLLWAKLITLGTD